MIQLEPQIGALVRGISLMQTGAREPLDQPRAVLGASDGAIEYFLPDLFCRWHDARPFVHLHPRDELVAPILGMKQ